MFYYLRLIYLFPYIQLRIFPCFISGLDWTVASAPMETLKNQSIIQSVEGYSQNDQRGTDHLAE